MRSVKSLVLLFVTVLAGGCIPDQTVSLYPLYDDQTITLEPALVGSWAADKRETWTFKKSEDKKYQLVIAVAPASVGAEKPEDETMELEACLVQLAGKLFLDLYSEDAGPTGAPAHVFAKIQIEGDSLQIGWFDEDWMRAQLEQETYLNHIRTPGGRIVLTTPTRDLQYFFSRHAWDNGADSENGPNRTSTEFHRVPNRGVTPILFHNSSTTHALLVVESQGA